MTNSSETEIIIADSGATKTDWCHIKGKNVLQRFTSKGISPVYQSKEEIAKEISDKVYPILKDAHPTAIYFYGSGCTEDRISIVRDAILTSFPCYKIEVHSDLIAATHSLCGNKPGIACILGTGSNSCQWDGQSIVKQISPLGFILGDEGSGADLGKRLVGDALKNQLDKGLKEMLLAEYELTPSIIINKVYRDAFPNRFLASLTPFLSKHINNPTIQRIITDSFKTFFIRNLMQYDIREKNVNFVGSIAWHFAAQLKEVALGLNIHIGSIVQSPMQGLIHYHLSNNG